MDYSEKLEIEKQIKSLDRKYNKLMKEFFAIEKEYERADDFERTYEKEKSMENRMQEIRELTSPLCDQMETLSDSIR